MVKHVCVCGHIEQINQFVTYLHLIIGTMQCNADNPIYQISLYASDYRGKNTRTKSTDSTTKLKIKTNQ